MKVKCFLAFFVCITCLHSIHATNYVKDGYTNKKSYNPFDTSHVYISATGNYTAVTLYLYDDTNHKADSIVTNIQPQYILASNTAPWQNGFQYSVSFNYIIKNTLPSGIYNWEKKIYFIVKSQYKNADITIVYPTNTEAAYDSAGGKCLYNTASTAHTKANILSFLRPLTNSEFTYNRNYTDPFMQWMARTHAYNYQVICDLDLDDTTEFYQSKIVCIAGHSEYWTRDARLNFDNFINTGKDAVILSGNTMWWQVRYSADKSQMICYKSIADPISNPLLKTINWPDLSLNYSVLKSIGVDWKHGAYPPSTLVSYHGMKGFKIVEPSSPLLAGTSLHLYDTLACPTAEYDGAVLRTVDAATGIPYIDTTLLGFCKMEMIGFDFGYLDQSSPPAKGYGTFIAFKKNTTSGNVINVASSNWCARFTPSVSIYLGGFGAKDSLKIHQIIKNSFDLLLAHQNIFANPANSCMHTTAIEQFRIQNSEFRIYPNPAQNNLTIIMPENSKATLNGIEITDVLGQQKSTEFINENGNTIRISIADYPSGVYYVRIKGQDAFGLTKFIKE